MMRRGTSENFCGLLKGGRIGYLFRSNRLKYLKTWGAYLTHWLSEHGMKELHTAQLRRGTDGITARSLSRCLLTFHGDLETIVWLETF